MESMEEIQTWIKRATILSAIILVLCLILILSMPVLMVDMVVIGVCAYYVWKRYSRAASTVLFGWQCLGFLALVATGGLVPVVFILKSIILYVFYKSMRATYDYHAIMDVEAELVDEEELP